MFGVNRLIVIAALSATWVHASIKSSWADGVSVPQSPQSSALTTAPAALMTPEEVKRLGKVVVGERKLQKNSSDSVTRLQLAQQYFQESYESPSKLNDADKHVQTVLKQDAGNAQAQLLAGRINMAQGKPELARSHFREAVRLSPNNPHAHIALGELLMKAGDKAGADKEFAEYRRIAAPVLPKPQTKSR